MSEPTTDEPKRSTPSVPTLLVLVAFFASGFAGLTYEIAWVRKATLVFGSTTFALSTVLAVFFLGWALGSRYFGRASAHTDRPLRLFAILEICIGACGLLSPWAFTLVESVYGSVYPAMYESAGALNATRAGLLIVCLILPTGLMGGTLPLLCRHFVSSRDGIMSRVGGLYGLNTLGAALGCAVCGFVLIPDLGVNAAIFIAAGLNLALGCAVLVLAPVTRLTKHAAANESPDSDLTAPGIAAKKLVYLLFFAIGFIALANEVIWTRYLSMLVKNSVHTYTLTLTVILVGIGLGSPLAGVLLRRVKDGAVPFGLTQIALGVGAIGLLLHPIHWWLRLAVDHADGGATRLVVLVVSLMLGPAILMGMSFPLAIRLASNRPLQAGADVGQMTFVNTVGGVLGALVTGFFLLPGLGLQATIYIVTGASVVVGLTALFGIHLATAQGRSTKLAIALVAVPIWIGLAATPELRIPRDVLGRNGALLAFEEGVNANLAVLRSEGETRLEIDGLWQGGTGPSHLMMSAHVPMLLHPEPKSALVIGLGTGQAARRFLHYGIDRLDCVEIEGELPRLLREHFDSKWLDDKRVRVLTEDGRSYVTHTDQKYDVISIAVGQTYRPGVASFYTQEFYERAKRALKPKGCVSQFVPTQLLTTREFQVLIATFVGAFPQSVLWYNTEEMLLVGRDVAAMSIAVDRLKIIDTDRDLNEALKFKYWGGLQRWVNRPESFLGGFMLGPKDLAALAKDTAPYSDDRPWIEYSTATSRDLHREQSGTIDLIRKHFSPLTSILNGRPAAASIQFSEAMRGGNLADMRAEALARAVNADIKISSGDAEAMFRKAIEWSPENVRIRRSMANYLLDTKRAEEARKLMKETLEIDPGDPVSHNVMGTVLATLDKADEAMAEFERAIKIDAANEVPHFNLGQILAHRGQFDKAAPHLKLCIERNPDHALAREWYGRVLSGQGKIVEAVEQLSHALRLAPGSPAAAQALVWILATHEHPDIPSAHETVAMAEQMAEATRGQSPAILDILAASYARAGRFAQAVKSATMAIDVAKEQKKPEMAAEIETRRKLYADGKPFLK